jgi:hypothetical protein
MPGIPATRSAAVSTLLIASLLVLADTTDAMPAFAREYGVSCNVCHAAYPRLNDFGNRFAGDMNFRMANWRDHTVPTGDDTLALPKTLPLAARVQAFIQARDAESVDPVSGEVVADSSLDFQAPYLIKLLSSAPLTDSISYYFYMIFAEKGANTEVIVEDAWFSYDDLFDTGVGLQLGQFQVSDLMFPREVRMTFQDFMAYRFAGITYDRGLLFGRGFGPVDVSLGFVNGNGIEENFNVTSPGYRRPDHLFDNDTGKSRARHRRFRQAIGPLVLVRAVFMEQLGRLPRPGHRLPVDSGLRGRRLRVQRQVGIFRARQSRRCGRPRRHRHGLRGYRDADAEPGRIVLLHAQREGRPRAERRFPRRRTAKRRVFHRPPERGELRPHRHRRGVLRESWSRFRSRDRNRNSR